VFSELTAIFGMITTVIMLVLAFRLFYRSPHWVDEKIESILSTFLEPDEEGKNLVDQLADRFGKGFRMSLLAQRGGEVRHEKMLESRVFSAVLDKSPELKIGMKALEEFGLGDLATPENLPALMQLAQKYGLFGLLKGNPTGGTSRSQYKNRYG